MKRLHVLCVLLLAGVCAAETQTWEIDPNHTTSQFSVRHLGISTVRGVFEKTAGTVVYDAADPAKTQIDATLDVSSVNTRIERRDNDLRSPNFFDVAKYATITFKSKKTGVGGQGRLKITGDLTIHGVTKEVVLDVDARRRSMPWAESAWARKRLRKSIAVILLSMAHQPLPETKCK